MHPRKEEPDDEDEDEEEDDEKEEERAESHREPPRATESREPMTQNHSIWTSQDEKKLMAEASSRLGTARTYGWTWGRVHSGIHASFQIFLLQCLDRAKERVQAELKKFRQAAIKGGY